MNPTTYWLQCGVRFKHISANIGDLDEESRPIAEAIVNRKKIFAIVTGFNGTGKSHFAAAVLKEFRHGMFITIAEMVNLARSLPLWADDLTTRGEFIVAMKTCKCLVLDEIGASTSAADETSIIDDVISFRHDRGLTTIMTSNVPNRDLPSVLGLRVIDRIRESAVELAMVGDSRRKPQGDSTKAPLDMFTGRLPKAPDTDPDGWREFLRTAGHAYTQYKYAPGFLKSEFSNAELCEPPEETSR